MNDTARLPVPYSIKRHGLSLANCDEEPVQTPGCIQAHGMLLAARVDSLVVTQVSENCARWTGLRPDEILGCPLVRVLGAGTVDRIRAVLGTEVLDRNPRHVATARLPGAPADADAMDMTIHTVDGTLLLELEPGSRSAPAVDPGDSYFGKIRGTIARFKASQSLADFCDIVAREARLLTGLDRVMVYRFHADHTGEVLADAHREDLSSWLGLRYPADDIPWPAREIFTKIGVRPLPDAQGELFEMVPLLDPDTRRPLEMTHCALRGASVMYTEYLKNMGVAATLTMPIMREGALWGLIACHHCTAVPLPQPLRSAAEFLGQIASIELSQIEAREHLQYRIHLDAVHLKVLARAAGDGQLLLASGASPGLLDGVHADGVAVFQRGTWQTSGSAPDDAELKPLGEWLRARIGEIRSGVQVFATDALVAAYPPAARFAVRTCGVLATALSRQPASVLIVWFRGEQVQTFSWAGNPHDKPTVPGPHGARLAPRRSFDLWEEQVRGRSVAWKVVETEAAESLRQMVIDLVVMRAERLADANAELTRSNAELDTFAYVLGHDLKEPLRGIHKYAHRLLENANAGRAPDPGRLQWLLRTTVRMDTLLDALLHYSQVGRLSLDFDDVDLGAMLAEALEMLGARLVESGLEVRVPRPLPAVHGDRARVREILSNLISNAAKYNDKPDPWVEIGYIRAHDDGSAALRPASTPAEAKDDTIFYVRDNGIGIEQRHNERVFAIFKRLHTQDAFGGGSGVGLTIVRKMVEQHRGRIWFESAPGVGSTFYFTLPAEGSPVPMAAAGGHG
jgi:two-component system, chemotaxis family, sensor kinase Cph1